MQRIFFISDMHFGHERIIKYENRPFKNADEMDRAIISNWNNKVKKDDKVFILGDFSFYNKEKTVEIIKSLHGRKVLICGNHDRGLSFWKDTGIEEISLYPVIFKDFYMLSHQPLYVNENMPYVNIHGHIHHVQYDNKQYFNVSVECINYTPILFEDIQKKIMEKYAKIE